MVRVRLREAVVGEVERRGVRVEADLVRRELAVAIGVRQRRVPAGDVGQVVDQFLGPAVPARRLDVAVGVVGHAAEGRAPAVAELEVDGGFDDLLPGRDPPIEALGVLRLGEQVEAALRAAEVERDAALPVGQLLLVRADGQRDVAADLGDVLALHLPGLGNEVELAADLARAVDGRRWAADDLDLGRVGDRRRIGAAVLDPLEAAEVVLRQGAADVERAGHAVETGRIGAGRDRRQVVD